MLVLGESRSSLVGKALGLVGNPIMTMIAEFAEFSGVGQLDDTAYTVATLGHETRG